MLSRIALSSVLLAALLQTGPAGADAKRVRIFVPTRDNLQYATFWVTRQAGCFAQRGIDTELVIPPLPRAIVPALVNGEATVAVVPPPSLMEALEAGADVVAVASLLRNESVNLIVRRELIAEREVAGSVSVEERMKRLQGVRIGVAPGPTTRLQRLLTHLSLGGDHFEMVVIRGPEQNQALADGQVDGLLCHTPYLERAILHQDAEVVVDLIGGEVPELTEPHIHTLVVQRSLLERDRELVVELVEAIRCGAEAARRTQRATELLQQEIPSRDPKEIALFARLYRPAIPENVEVSVSGLQAMLKRTPGERAPPDLTDLVWERHVDPSLVPAE
jgi:ABC-type nitrate/sulfonate/bicarbonate transport system substrate-binding protein